MESKKDDVKGNVELPDDRKFELDDEGRAKPEIAASIRARCISPAYYIMHAIKENKGVH